MPMRERALLGGTVFFFCLWVTLTMQRVALWQDPIALWGSAVLVSPCFERPRAQLALAYQATGQTAAANHEWLIAAEIVMSHQCPSAP